MRLIIEQTNVLLCVWTNFRILWSVTSIVLVRRVKKQIAEMTDVLVDVKNGNGNRRILSAINELTAPLAYEINEIVASLSLIHI